MISFNIDIKKLSLSFIVFMMSLTFLIGPALEIIPTYLIFMFRLMYLIALFLMILSFNKARNIHLLLLFLILFFLMFKFESIIFINYLSIILLCMYLRFYQVEEVVTKVFTTVCIMVSFHWLLYKFGFVADSIDAYYSGRSRTSMGFSNPNQLAIFYFSVFIVSYAKFILLKNSSIIKLIIPFVLIIYSIYLIVLSDSRTSLFGCAIVISSHVLLRGELSKLLILRLSVFMVVLLTILIAFSHGTFLNTLLSLRPILFYNELIKMEGFSFFFGLFEIKQVDSLVVILLNSLGFPIFFVLWVWSIYSINKMDIRFFPLIVATLLMSVFEAFLLRPELPISLLFLSFIVSSKVILPKNNSN